MTKIIALDAGHGLKTAGKQTLNGKRGVIKEWTLNDKVRDFIVECLKDYDVKFIFPDNNEGNVDESLASRVNAYVKCGADVMVSIHHNAYQSKWGTHTGVEIWTDKGPTTKDTALAKAIYKYLPGNTGLRGRGIKAQDWAVINQDRIPAVLVEGGFMDSSIDYNVITSTEGQKAYAKAVAQGLIDFLCLKKKETEEQKHARLVKENAKQYGMKVPTSIKKGQKFWISRYATFYGGAHLGKPISEEVLEATTSYTAAKGTLLKQKYKGKTYKFVLAKEINSYVRLDDIMVK